MTRSWSVRRTDLVASLALTILPALFYPLAALRRGVFYIGDIFRLYYPQRAVYADALRHAHLPLWTPDVLAGFPLLAEGQTGVFYPLNLLLYHLLPIDVALNYSILLAVSLAGIAMYVLGRVVRLRPAAAFLAAVTFAYSGFLVGHFNHLNIMAAAPWLPLQLAIIEKALQITPKAPSTASNKQRTATRWPRTALIAFLGLVSGIQFLAGHPQIWLMSALVALVFGAFRAIWPTGGTRPPLSRALKRFAPIGLATIVGLGLAAIQFLPTWELVQHSVRAGGLSEDFFTSFSWHPALLGTLIVPFALGNPYPNISVELAAYLGLLPLALAFVPLITRRDRLSAFLAGLAVLSLALAFGDYTPIYGPLAQIPVLNLFRVPARFLYLFTLAIALLAGRGLDAILTRFYAELPKLPSSAALTALETVSVESSVRTGKRVKFRRLSSILIVGGVIASAIAVWAAGLDTLLALRFILPAVILVLTLALLTLARRQRLGRHTFIWMAIGLTLIDLFAFKAVYRLTYNDLMSLDEFYDKPRSLEFFPEDNHNYRTLTHEEIVPALSVMRASLYPNTSLLHDISSANGYFPLLPARHARYLRELTPGRLNLLNVRYFLIPQLLPVDPETERYDLYNPFTPDLVGRTVDVPPTPTERLELISFTSQSAGWPQGELVAEIVLTTRTDVTIRLPVRAGQETAEWAYDRTDVSEQIAHDRPLVAQTWSARSGFPPEDHAGHAYRARYELPASTAVTQIQVVPAKPAGLFHIEELTLIEQNQRHTVADLLGLGHHKLVYRDPDVVAYENLDALPRAFIVDRARVVPDDEAALTIIDDPAFNPRAEVLLEGSTAPNLSLTPSWDEDGSGETTSEISSSSAPIAQITQYSPRRVEIRTELVRPGYLVLLDSYYPGWKATVDDQPAAIHRANVLFRAVALKPGRHTVTFVYDPITLKAGTAITLVALIGLCATYLLALRRGGDAGRLSHRPSPHP